MAFTRAPSPNLAQCQLTHIGRHPIDVARAAMQHAAYEAALQQAGCTIMRLPDLPACADGVFVEDMALLLGEVAIVTRPGSQARVAEAASVRDGLAAHVEVMPLPCGRLDGGDVLQVGQRLFVGLSSRSDKAGAQALADLAGGLGFSVQPVRVTGCLHLKTAATWLGDGRLLANPAWVDMSAFEGLEWLAVAAGEPWAANTLRLGATLLVAKGSPHTGSILTSTGYDVRQVDISELQKAEAGLTCMSLVQP
jgi:dimethylargininase